LHILSGDIGGTKTTLALFESKGPATRLLVRKTFASKQHDSLEDVLRHFLTRDIPVPDVACFGLAGPVHDGMGITTNLPWRIAAKELGREFCIPKVYLINDLEANAWSINHLPEKDLHTLYPGKPDATGNRSIISAGTGLGEAGLFWDGRKHIPFASEGGHASFSPTNALEIALLEFLLREHAQVSWELVVSGMGLVNIHAFLLDHHQESPPDWLAQEMETGDAAAAISSAARQARCPLCVQALDMFVHLYGVEAGNHALKIMATSGVYIGGGIAPKILDALAQPAFLDGFFAKGGMEPLMRDMPVHVILNADAALYGAALYARMRING